MSKFSSLASNQKHNTRAAACGLLACLLISAGQVASANDWVPNKRASETFDLTAVPEIDKDTYSSAASNRNTDTTQNTETNHAPYLMLSAPSSSSSAKSAAPLKLKNKTPEYDLTISDFDATTNSTPAPKKSFLSRMSSAPAKAIGVTCGVCVGVPVSIARDTRKYTGQMKKSMDDGFAVEKRGDIAGHMWSGACSIPFGVGSGLVHGSVTGFQRAVEHGKTQPLSKKSMSLGAPEKSLSNRSGDIGNN